MEQERFGASRTLELVLQGVEDAAWLVRLCGESAGAAMADRGLSGGLWPDTRTFDLVLERRDGRLSARQAPGHLLWNWSLGAPESAASPADIESLWQRDVLP